MQTDPIEATCRIARRIAISVVGITVLLIGVIMIFTPGPAIIFIPVGLAILGLEFAWARSWLKSLRERISANRSSHLAARAERHRDRHMGQ